MITPDKWLWDGHAAHLIVGSNCQFHMATRVGRYIISTVGEYRPPAVSTAPTDGKRLGGELYEEFESIGLGRLFETYVFNAKGRGFEVRGWNEIDSLSANDHTTAVKNHMRMCKKYAKEVK